MESKKFYRYEWYEQASLSYDGDDYFRDTSYSNPKIRLETFELVKETEKGYWITYSFFSNYKKWIPKESRKRFAYPTKEEALTNLIKRTEKRISLLERQLKSCKTVVMQAKDMVNIKQIVEQ
jgi:hypothetical protein